MSVVSLPDILEMQTVPVILWLGLTLYFLSSTTKGYQRILKWLTDNESISIKGDNKCRIGGIYYVSFFTRVHFQGPLIECGIKHWCLSLFFLITLIISLDKYRVFSEIALSEQGCLRVPFFLLLFFIYLYTFFYVWSLILCSGLWMTKTCATYCLLFTSSKEVRGKKTDYNDSPNQNPTTISEGVVWIGLILMFARPLLFVDPQEHRNTMWFLLNKSHYSSVKTRIQVSWNKLPVQELLNFLWSPSMIGQW